jgi:hypothetical protein
MQILLRHNEIFLFHNITLEKLKKRKVRKKDVHREKVVYGAR